REVVERTYWLAGRGFYAFATALPRKAPPVAESGPDRARRQTRMDALRNARLVDEDTVLPAVPLWFDTLDPARAQLQIDRLGAGALATDWGSRILSERSELYDPLSYHYGSVWPLFTGWTSMGAYKYGRPHVGLQALMANALLTYDGALGYVTELLSGELNAAFGRSSHHQVWSEAMVVTPLLRGLLGIEPSAGGGVLRCVPQLPANWDRMSAHNIAAGNARYDFSFTRTIGRLDVIIDRRTESTEVQSQQPPARVILAPAFPLDAVVRAVSVNGRRTQFERRLRGDIQQAEIVILEPSAKTSVVFSYDDGSDVYQHVVSPAPGDRNAGLRVLRSRAGRDSLQLTLEGRAGRAYSLRMRTQRKPGRVSGGELKATADGDPELVVAFEGTGTEYVRKEVIVALSRPLPR
ncbi:MAG: amylo-alpha-1,6-glucosidase, partial [Acidobacteria bacterium]|nr:amylo-alpha-1,6-glucosidase [Acidobacteriota bacterium]